MPHFLSRLADTLSLDNQRLFAVALVLSIAPLWFGRYLPMIDMPQHAAQIAALQQIWSGNETFTRLFQVNWFTPYLLGYMLLYVVSLLVPITIAAKLVVSAAVVTVPMLTAGLLHAAGADERWKWLAIPTSFGFAFYWGFLSFIVAVPLALLFLIQTVHFVRTPSVGRGIGVAAFAVFLFFCHVIVLGFASLTALGYVVGSGYRDLKSLLWRALPYTAPLPLIAVWLFISYCSEAVVQNGPTVFGPLLPRLMGLLTQPAGREAFSAPLCLAVTGCVLLLPGLCGSRFSHKPERWLPFALALFTYLAAPAYVLGTAYFYQRLGIFLVPLWLLMWDPPAGPARRLDRVAMLVAVVWAFLNTGRFAAFARETEGFDHIMGAVPQGRRVASLVQDNSSGLFAGPVYLNFPAWYQATHAGISDFNFADFYSQMVRYKPDAGPRITELLAWAPTELRWDANGCANYDYFIVRAGADVSGPIFKEKRGAVELVAQQGWWWLYRNNERKQ